VTRSLAYDTVAGFYDVWIAQMPLVTEKNRRFYVREYLATEGPVLELGVGNGRIMIEAARAGKRVVGVDHSAKMLAPSNSMRFVTTTRGQSSPPSRCDPT
jgi:ubiquinone/menaquinone biosynthesis C-methylase UbiE